MAVEHSGNVRSTGPKPPMLAIPDRQPINGNQQLAFQGFIQQLVLDTGWQPGAPTNMWLVGYDVNGGATAKAVAAVATSTSKPMDGKSKQLLEQALGCNGVVKSFDVAESALKQAGWAWSPEQLDAYVAHPRKAVVGGKMKYDGLDDPAARADVIAYLASIH